MLYGCLRGAKAPSLLNLCGPVVIANDVNHNVFLWVSEDVDVE